jgi:hypothetical protein
MSSRRGAGDVVTLDADQDLRVDEGSIRIIPMWRWAISEIGRCDRLVEQASEM